MFQATLADSRRAMLRFRTAVLIGAVAAYGVWASAVEVDAIARGADVSPTRALAVAVGLQVLWLLVLGLPIALGGNLAADLSTGYMRLLLARGLTRYELLTARLLSFGLSSAASVASVTLLIVGGSSRWPSPAMTTVGSAVSFAPRLIEQSMWWWVALVAAIYTLACVAALALSALVGAYASPASSAIAAPIAILVLGFLLVGHLWSANPLERISFLQIHGADWVTPLSMLDYWATAVAATAALGVMAFARKDV